MAVHVGSLPRPHCTPAITNVNHIKIINIISLCQKGLEKKILTDFHRYCTKVQEMKSISLPFSLR